MKLINKNNLKISIIFLLIILFTTLLIIFKLLNNVYNGNQEWSEVIWSGFNSQVVSKWFENTNHFLQGPIGFYSMFQSKLYVDSTFLTPIFLDAFINWMYVIILIILLTILVLQFWFKKQTIKTNETIVQKNKSSLLIIKEKVIREDKLIKKTSYDKVSKKYLVERLTEMYPDYKKKTIDEIVKNLFQNVENHLISGEEVIIENFGKLIKVEKPVKQAINPSNGEIVEVPATTIIKFKPSRNLKLIMSDTKWTGIKYNKKTIETITIEEEQK
ncbi:HU family DNA-binding protein [Mesoplasma florum]|uniref:HU family DNA-binding protein n=1 Tax=Mesoplasma florum TaxID=2151 RepID=UPI000BE3D51E|nr:HU family DNA-binding protein [Mesoplasma florum]ATI73386.1 hypothetical protein CQZ69_02330 [Mesoplasma florum]AVN61785.1 hypothetical protein CG004_02330 [Mesoplasma florum]